MDFKDFTNSFFTKINWTNVSEDIKTKYAFILNRRFSKKYPLLASNLSQNNTPGNNIINFWRVFLGRDNKIPYWWWDKKGTKKEKSDFSNIELEIIKLQNIDLYKQIKKES